MKKIIILPVLISLFFSNFVVLPAFAFESSGVSGNLSFEIHAGSLNSVTGSSSASNFAVFSGGGENALGLSIGSSIFQVFSSVVNWFFSFFTLRYDQVHYRWRNDDGSESGATFAAAEDTSYSDLAKSTLIRLRFAIANEGWSRSGDSSPQFRIQYSETATCSSGTYTDVPATATSEHWEMSNSVNLTDAGATTNVASGLTDTNASFLAGQVKDTGNQTSAIAITSDKFTEIEYSIEATAGSTAGANYCFRLNDNGSSSNFVYSVYPSITISAGGAPAINQLHYRWRNDNGSEAGASFAKAEDTISTDDFFVGDRVRLRFLFKNTGTGAATNYAFRLEHSSTSCSVWVNLPTPEIAGTGGSHWSMDYTSNLINDSATTDSNGLTNPTGTFTAGKSQTSNSTASVSTISSENFSEYEYSIVSNSNAETGVNYCFRLTNAGDTSVFTYSSQPQITLTNRQRPFGGGSSSGDEGGGSGPVQGGGGSGGGSGSGGEGSGSGDPVGGGGGGGGGGLE